MSVPDPSEDRYTVCLMMYIATVIASLMTLALFCLALDHCNNMFHGRTSYERVWDRDDYNRGWKRNFLQSHLQILGKPSSSIGYNAVSVWRRHTPFDSALRWGWRRLETDIMGVGFIPQCPVLTCQWEVGGQVQSWNTISTLKIPSAFPQNLDDLEYLAPCPVTDKQFLYIATMSVPDPSEDRYTVCLMMYIATVIASLMTLALFCLALDHCNNMFHGRTSYERVWDRDDYNRGWKRNFLQSHLQILGKPSSSIGYNAVSVWRRHTPFDSALRWGWRRLETDIMGVGFIPQCPVLTCQWEVGGQVQSWNTISTLKIPSAFPQNLDDLEYLAPCPVTDKQFLYIATMVPVRAVWRRRPHLSALRIKWGMAPTYRGGSVELKN
eukprot:sb/3465660/